MGHRQQRHALNETRPAAVVTRKAMPLFGPILQAMQGELPGSTQMAGGAVPHFQNDAGHAVIGIGVKEFKCVGARPPFDHPHVFLDMGGGNEPTCPYCSTLYTFDPALRAGETRPPDCLFVEEAA